MENKIEYIELILSDFSIYRINKSNILECDFLIEDEQIDIEDGGNFCVPIIESFLLVVDDYTKILNYDSEEDFDVNGKNISQVAIYFEDDFIKIAYVNMTNLDTNNNQKNHLKDNTLYITIENE